MARRQAPTADHEPPAPDWVLGPDGHWKPPPFTEGTTAPTRRPKPTPDPDAPADPRASTRSSPGPAVIFAVILVVVAVAYLAWISLSAI